MRTSSWLAAALFALVAIRAAAEPEPNASDAFLDAGAVSWKVNAHQIARWKTLVGGIEGGQLEASDVQFGLWELAPHATYHGHKHAAPEIYFVTSGRGRWQVGDTVEEVAAGTTIYTRPGQVHSMVNSTGEPLRAIWVWWAPGGDSAVFAAPYEFTEPAPVQPPGASFGEDAERRY